MEDEMKLFMGKKFCLLRFMFLLACMLCISAHPALAEDEPAGETVDLGGVTVQAERLQDNIDITPGAITINLEDYQKAGVPHTILDILKDRAIIDFRDASDLAPTNDDIQMRGFDSRQFTTAVDGLAIQKVGGWWGGHFVDYSIIPMEQIESIEILPGPHSALYDGKSFGGVINIKTKAPVKRETPEVKFKASTSYASFDTYDSSVTMSGGGGNMDYVLGVKEYHTDGYLKNNEYDLSTVSGRMAWLLPNDGYMSLLGSYSDKKEGQVCENDPDGTWYDNDYPVVKRGDVSSRWRDPSMKARREKKPYSLRFNWQQPSEIGRWTVGAYYSYDDQNWAADIEPTTLNINNYDTNWSSMGAKIHNEFYLTDNHLVTIGTDGARMEDRDGDGIVQTVSGFIQDKWYITDRFSLTPGLRYEKIRILWSNESGTGYANPAIPHEYVERNYDDVTPKAFATYELDGVADWLRDTSVSMGLSKVWTPRATCEVCTWGSGVELDPTEGYGLDLIFQRRVWKDIIVMLDFSHYEFDNYPVWAPSSTDYFQNSPWGRRMVGLDDITKNGVEMEINGSLTEKLSMNISAAYSDYEYNGPKGGIEEMSTAALSDRAKYRINSGLTYDFTDRLWFHLDYKHQDKQEREVIEVIDEDTGEFDVRTIKIDSYGVMDVSLSYRFLEKWHRLENPVLKVFINNALDKDYVNVSGYPATERTYGASFSMSL